MHALLALDHYHARRYERGPGDDAIHSVKAEERGRRADTSTSALTHTLTSSGAPRIPMPLPTYPRKSPLSYILTLALLTLYDTTVITVLIAHTINFFHVIHTNWDACDTYVSPYPENFMDPMNTSMSVLERCQRICTDSYVSGGFDVAMSVVLTGVHVWHLARRLWEGWVFGVDGDIVEDGRAVGEARGSGVHGSGEGHNPENECGGLQGGEARSTAIRCRDWSAEGRTKRARSCVREGSVVTMEWNRSCSVESAQWSEILLECLVP